MEVTSIQNGIIIDHVPAGTSLKVLEYLKIDPAKTKLALIMNADSKRYGSKDIIKIEDDKDIDLDVLGFVARQATVDVVRGGRDRRKEAAEPARAHRRRDFLREPALRDHRRARHQADVPPRALRAARIPLRLLRRGSQTVSITLRNIKVWNTGEVIDLVVPGTAAAYFADTSAVADGADIDATGLTVAPGFEDPHVHFRRSRPDLQGIDGLRLPSRPHPADTRTCSSCRTRCRHWMGRPCLARKRPVQKRFWMPASTTSSTSCSSTILRMTFNCRFVTICACARPRIAPVMRQATLPIGSSTCPDSRTTPRRRPCSRTPSPQSATTVPL